MILVLLDFFKFVHGYLVFVKDAVLEVERIVLTFQVERLNAQSSLIGNVHGDKPSFKINSDDIESDEVVGIIELKLSHEICLYEAKLIIEHKIPHIIYLIGLSSTDVTDLIKKWISNDFADKERLKVFKKLFSYNDNTGHIDNSIVEITDYSPIDHTHFLNFLEDHKFLLKD